MSRSYRTRGPQNRRGSTAIAALMALALFTAVACGSAADNPLASQGQEGREASGSSVISYAGAASRLDGLEPTDAEEQLRDWARTGLASLLGFDTAQLRDTFYDTVPVRDPAFSDLAEQPTGPGRALYDGRGVLHVLVPHNDPHAGRTIGLLIDDFRTDAGIDAGQVAIHRYQIHPENRTITLASENPAPTAEARAAHGYVEMRVDQADGLTAFLAQTQHLSLLEVRGSEIWAGGWLWPGTPGGPLTHEDVSVIQRGYRSPSPEPLPGFSLDAGPTETRDDLLALLPSLRPDLVDGIVTGGFPADLAKMVNDALFQNQDVRPSADALSAAGLPSERTQLWALKNLVEGGPAYSQARYYGRLEGTEVGMTLFYTDYVAKDWTSGVGTGVPTEAVGGFIPDPEAMVPWGHCEEAGDSSETGRLWFGQSDSGFIFDDGKVSIGANAIRLFARSDSDGGEVEPSYGFGRGLRWWDEHYQAVADYEPQYHRLDQIMRWSSAVEWLVSQTGVVLPQLNDAAIRSDLRFQDWYAAHDDLQERSPIVFVQPPSTTQEAVLDNPSTTYESCGRGRMRIVGGVELSNRSSWQDPSFPAAPPPSLPPSVGRAGLYDPVTTFNPETGAGRIRRRSVDSAGRTINSLEHTISTPADGPAIVEVVTDGRREASLGNLKVWRAETAPRRLTLELSADAGQISQRVDLQGWELGELIARNDATGAMAVQWRPGPADRLRQALESVQNRLSSGRAAGPLEPTGGVLYRYEDSLGAVVYRVGDQAWLSISGELSPPGEDLALRFGGPSPENGQPEFRLGHLVPPPNMEAAWIDVTPATAERPATVDPSDAPGPDVGTVRVATPDGITATVHHVGDRLRVAVDDPLLGLFGASEGAALLRDFPVVEAAMSAAAQAQDGLFRVVLLGDEGVALAAPDQVIIVGAVHPWTAQVLGAIDPDDPIRAPLFRIENGQAIVVGT